MIEHSTAVHFTIDADFLHGHARDLWSEGEFDKAMDFLDTIIGITPVQKHRIINGNLKFVEIGKTQEFKLVKDKWKPDLKMCHFCQYPDPDNGEQMEEARAVLAEDDVKKAFSHELYVLQNEIDENRRAQNILRDFFRNYDLDKDPIDEGFLVDFRQAREKIYDVLEHDERLFAGRVWEIPNALHALDTLNPKKLLSGLDKFMEDQKLNTVVDAVAEAGGRLEPSGVYENGIITSDGKFYRCGSMGHNVLAIALGYPSDNSDSEFAALQAALADGCCAMTSNLSFRHIRKGKGGVSDAQRQRIKEWFELTAYNKAPFFQYEYEDSVE